jgi:hypothetical protein
VLVGVCQTSIDQARAHPIAEIGHLTSPVRLSIPEGLDHLVFTASMPLVSINFSDLRASLQDIPCFSVERDGLGIQGLLAGGPSLPGGHAHLTVSRESSEQEWSIELEIFPRTPQHTIDACDIHTLPEILKGELSRGGMTEGLLGASFTVLLTEWEAAVPLPYAPADLLSDIPGAPEIAGIDFSFSDTETSQHRRGSDGLSSLLTHQSIVWQFVCFSIIPLIGHQTQHRTCSNPQRAIFRLWYIGGPQFRKETHEG